MRDKATFHTLNNPLFVFFVLMPDSSKFNFWTPLKRSLGRGRGREYEKDMVGRNIYVFLDTRACLPDTRMEKSTVYSYE